MTEKITYVADDGTEFECEDDCREYEVAQEILPSFENVQMWDCCKKPIPTPTCWIEIESALSEMYYIRGSDLEEFWNAIYNNNMEHMMLDYDSFRREVYNMDDSDLLMFDSEVDNWVNVNYLFDEYRKILKNFG